jgi:hypothetical protein
MQHWHASRRLLSQLPQSYNRRAAMVALLVLTAVATAVAIDNGRGWDAPPMGWRSWNQARLCSCMRRTCCHSHLAMHAPLRSLEAAACTAHGGKCEALCATACGKRAVRTCGRSDGCSTLCQIHRQRVSCSSNMVVLSAWLTFLKLFQ